MSNAPRAAQDNQNSIGAPAHSALSTQHSALAVSRRAWLANAAAAASAAALGTLPAWAGDKPRGFVKIADLIALRNDHAVEIAKPEAILSRTKDGLACMGAHCTHRRNKLCVDRHGTIYCPVHDSIFDLAGKPVTGPASRPLNWYLTQVEESGAVSVDTSKTVKHGQWAALPDWAKPKP